MADRMARQAGRSLDGLHAALMTPYDEAGEIAEADLRRLAVHALDQDLDGLYVGGSTGEGLLQTTTERERIFRVVAEAADGRGTLIGQVGAVGTREARTLARACAGAGYHAVSAIPPIYFKHSKAGIRGYFEAIVEAADGLPLVIYNIPAMSGVTFSLAELVALLDIPGVVGMKQTAIDMYQMEQLRRRRPDALLLNGYDEMLLAGFASGANGGIGSTYNIMGRRYSELVRRLRGGDAAGALAIQSECNAVIDVLVAEGVFPGLKYLLHRLGVIGTPVCREPLDTLRGPRPALDAIAASLGVPAAG